MNTLFVPVADNWHEVDTTVGMICKNKTVYGLPSTTLNLFTNSNQLTDSLKSLEQKAFSFINIKRERKEGHYGPKGG